MSVYKRHNSPNWWIRYTDADGKFKRQSTGTTDQHEAEVIFARKMAEVNAIKTGRLADNVSFIGEREFWSGDSDERIARLESMVGDMRLLMATQYELFRQWVEKEAARNP